MKKAFVYAALILALSLLLCGCGSTRDDGIVTASPWPEVTEPILPTPSAMVSSTPMPERIPGSGTDIPAGTAMPDMSSASPRSTETGR